MKDFGKLSIPPKTGNRALDNWIWQLWFWVKTALGAVWNGSGGLALHTHETTAQAGQLDHGLALTGLTDDDHTQYALLVGRAGGQILRGGTAAGDDLQLISTTHATKGLIYLGNLGTSAFDEVNGWLGIGTAAPDAEVTVQKDGGAATLHVKTYATGGGSRPGVIFTRANGSVASPTALQAGDFIGELTGRGHDGTALLGSARAGIRMRAAANWALNDHPTEFDFVTTPVGGASPVVRFLLDSQGNVVVGAAALLTTATDGFLYLGSCPGVPSGTPTTHTGRVPLVVDSSNGDLYIYVGGAWVNLRDHGALDGLSDDDHPHYYLANGTRPLNGPLDHDGSTVGFFATTPATRPAAYTQTYSTATRTHSALTSAALTDSTTGTADATVVDVGGAFSQATLNNNFADLVAQVNALRVDLANTRQVLNQVLDDLQTLGLLQ